MVDEEKINDIEYIDKIQIKDINFDTLKKKIAIPLIKILIQRLKYYRKVYLLVTIPRQEILNQNHISVLVKIARLVAKNKNGYEEVKVIYQNIGGIGSPSGNISALLSLGLIEHYYTEEDKHNGIKNNGKYRISRKGYDFLLGIGKVNLRVKTTPIFSYIEGEMIKSRKIEPIGDLVDIYSKEIKWKTRDEIMNEVIQFRNEHKSNE